MTPKATNPDTGQPFDYTVTQKLVAWLWERAIARLLPKLLVMIGSASAFAAGTFGFTPTATELIGVGAGAFLLGLIDFIRSQIGRKLNLPLKPLQKIQEETEAEEYENHPRPTLFGPNSFTKPFIDDNPTMTGIIPLGLGEALATKDIVPPRTWVVGWKMEGDKVEARRYKDSYVGAVEFRDVLKKTFQPDANGYVMIYEPGDVMP